MGLLLRDISSRLQISLGTVHNLLKRFEETGEVAAKERSSRPHIRKLDDLHELYSEKNCTSC